MNEYTCDKCGRKSFSAAEETDRPGCPCSVDLCDTCTQPCNDLKSYSVTYEEGRVTACDAYVEEGSGDGPTGEDACDECSWNRDDMLTTEAWGVVSTDCVGRSCHSPKSEGTPEPGRYCPEWTSNEDWEDWS